MKFFNLDLHISVIADIKHIFKKLNIEVENWSLSGHTWVFKKTRDDVKVITAETWKSLDEAMILKFQEEYDDYLSSFDGFIVGFPTGFIQLYEKYNKPIISVVATRYDLPYCFTGNYEGALNFNKCIQRLSQKGLLHSITNNKADKDYFLMGNPGIDIKYIPSLCEYTNMKWDISQSDRKFLVYSGDTIVPSHPILEMRSKIGAFEWTDLTKYRGIVHIPYEASTMSICEHITSGIPLFFPTKRFLKELWTTKKAHFQSNYWNDIAKVETPIYLKDTMPHDFWIERADYYDIPGYYYFDSFDELINMIVTFFGDPKFEERKLFIQKRKEYVYSEFSSILAKM